jgi:hypothetical protein
MYYLWKDKKSTKDEVIVYITDYKEFREDGKVKIDNYGYMEVELIKTSNVKTDLLEYAQKIIKNYD